MRLPLTPHGTRELILFGGLLLLLAAGAWLLHPWAAALPLLLLLFVLSFFRDPERRAPGGPETVVAPADGKVTDIGELEDPEILEGRLLRIGIFLSVFDVHVNRAPLDGKITRIRYQPGEFLDARHPEAGRRNEANLAVFDGPFGPYAIRQVAGLVARRIVFPFAEGDPVRRGQRMGMIKFGSRTELYVPADGRFTPEVEIGRKVRGASTVLGRYVS